VKFGQRKGVEKGGLTKHDHQYHWREIESMKQRGGLEDTNGAMTRGGAN